MELSLYTLVDNPVLFKMVKDYISNRPERWLQMITQLCIPIFQVSGPIFWDYDMQWRSWHAAYEIREDRTYQMSLPILEDW